MEITIHKIWVFIFLLSVFFLGDPTRRISIRKAKFWKLFHEIFRLLVLGQSVSRLILWTHFALMVWIVKRVLTVVYDQWIWVTKYIPGTMATGLSEEKMVRCIINGYFDNRVWYISAYLYYLVMLTTSKCPCLTQCLHVTFIMVCIVYCHSIFFCIFQKDIGLEPDQVEGRES